MSTLYQIQNRYKLIFILITGVISALAVFWSVEFYYSLQDVAKNQTRYIEEHHEQLIDAKAEEFRILFHEIYQSARTISLLPMVRDLRGTNRTSEDEDIVRDGRLSSDAHRTLQQIYTNLENNVSVSEVYYVLDGFDPDQSIPVFMYDNLIAGINDQGESGAPAPEDAPEELEDEEYRHFPQQLDWFRSNAPNYLWAHALDQIPVRLSPLLRTCDNSQYNSIRHGQVTDSHGLIYALPVYTLDTLKFKGMITVVLRSNVLEARLLGVPFLPITNKDITRQKQQGWSMPESSMFQLIQDEYGITIKDRRNTLFNRDDATPMDGRWIEKEYELTTGVTWKLKHYLTPSAITEMTQPFIKQRQTIITSRILIISVIGMFVAWATMAAYRLRDHLMRLAYFDSLTGLPNRVQLFDCMQHKIRRSGRDDLKLSILIVNISNFGAVNQNYGHDVGDALLIDFTKRLQTVIGSRPCKTISTDKEQTKETLLARLSGDEFAIVSTNFVDEFDISKVIQSIRKEISHPFVVQDSIEIKVNVNIGVSIYPHDATSASKLLACADTALQECRRQGSTVYCLFDNELRQRCDRLNRLSEDIKLALDKQQFEIMYQPKQSIADGRIVSLEALLRWRHPELGYISPLEFIPILEHNNGIIEVGLWVMDQACQDLGRLSKEGYESTGISVNVSVGQLRSDNFHLDVADTLERHGTDPKRLILEITESMMMENMRESLTILQQLSSMELPIAIDDFGTGYSSLTYLQSLPLTYLKLDKAFIDGMVNERTYHIVKTVIQLAKGINLLTIAEGIETDEQRNELAKLGCDIIQGYLLSRPKPLTEIIEWMRGHYSAHKQQ